MRWCGFIATAPGASPTTSGATASAWCCSARTGPATAIRLRRWSTRCGRIPGVSSVQITFHEDREAERHAMPPGGFRLAVVNAWSLQSGRAGRDLLRRHFLGA